MSQTRGFILVTGPNASGKSSVVERLKPIYRHRPVIFVHPDTDGYYKQAPALMFKRIWESWELLGPDVVILEGTDRPSRAVFQVSQMAQLPRQFSVMCLSQEPAAMKAHLKLRCEKAGKTFREDYWDEKKLVYEGSKRYRNMVQREAARAHCISYHPVDVDFKTLDGVEAQLCEWVDAILAGQ